MPLHAEHEGKGGVFERLDDAVGTLRDDPKGRSRRFHGLMVLRVDGEIFLPDDRGEKRAGNDFNLVHGFNVVALLTVGRKGEAELFGNVLDERTARDDVQHLQSPADREDGKSFAQRRAGERTLCFVAFGENRPALFGLFFAVELRVDVGAARQKEARGAFDERLDRVFVEPHGDLYGKTAGVDHGVEILTADAFAHGVAEEVRRNEDEGTGGSGSGHDRISGKTGGKKPEVSDRRLPVLMVF